ncbi:cytochrome c oxidase subunit NDUFA4-like isoform X2 [Brachyistius frenatus]|uniref:cytochrome c oxidase subunit NDUFA4-like isoform X2 n=1 Tax=Brachyistius frenatus TaxID=100188 RepID=UPI0037E700EC
MIKTMIQQAKKHPGLIPQLFFTSLGITGAMLYLLRLARGPHVTFWDKKNNPEPWNKLDPTYQYKVTSPFTHLWPSTQTTRP